MRAKAQVNASQQFQVGAPHCALLPATSAAHMISTAGPQLQNRREQQHGKHSTSAPDPRTHTKKGQVQNSASCCQLLHLQQCKMGCMMVLDEVTVLTQEKQHMPKRLPVPWTCTTGAAKAAAAFVTPSS